MAEDPGPTFYELLEVDPRASTDAIQAAYRVQAKRFHPDTGGSAAHFRLIKIACDTLSDPVKRREYDQRRSFVETGPTVQGEQPPAGPSRQAREREVVYCGYCGRRNQFDDDALTLTDEYVCCRCGRPLGWPQRYDGGVDRSAFRATRQGQWVDLVWAGDAYSDDEPVRVRGRIIRLGSGGERYVDDELSATTIRVADAAVRELLELR